MFYLTLNNSWQELSFRKAKVYIFRMMIYINSSDIHQDVVKVSFKTLSRICHTISFDVCQAIPVEITRLTDECTTESDQKNSLKLEWVSLFWNNIDWMFLLQKIGKIQRKYLCMFHATSTNSAEWISIWMIKSDWSANTRRENLLPEILIRGDKKTKISQFVLFVREHVLKVSLWEESLARADQGGRSGKFLQKLPSDNWYHTVHPRDHLHLNFLVLLFFFSLMCTNTVKNLQIFPNPCRRSEVEDERTEVWLGQMSKLH